MLANLPSVVLLVFPALAIVAALTDATSMTIPNWISASLVLAFAPAALLAHAPLTEIGVAVGLGLLALVVGAAMFALRWLGGGDAKLLAASVLWMGASGALPFLAWTAVAGGAVGLGLIAARRAAALAGASSLGPAWLGRLLKPEGDIPYGIAIAAGALAAFPQSGLTLAARALA